MEKRKGKKKKLTDNAQSTMANRKALLPLTVHRSLNKYSSDTGCFRSSRGMHGICSGTSWVACPDARVIGVERFNAYAIGYYEAIGDQPEFPPSQCLAATRMCA